VFKCFVINCLVAKNLTRKIFPNKETLHTKKKTRNKSIESHCKQYPHHIKITSNTIDNKRKRQCNTNKDLRPVASLKVNEWT